MNILVLCLGNVNRSPLCEAVLKKHGVHTVRSAGFNPGGRRAAKKTRELAYPRGYNIEFHRSQQLDQEMYSWADTVIYMDEGNRKRLLAFEKSLPVSTPIKPSRCLGQWANPIVTRIKDPGFLAVADPELPRIIDQVIDASRRLAKTIVPAGAVAQAS